MEDLTLTNMADIHSTKDYLMSQNNSNAQAQQSTPDFSHRVKDYFSVTSTSDLIEEVDTMVLRSKGILSIIADLHIESHINQINPQQIHWAINSVMRELDDIYAVIESHHDALRANQQT